MATVTLPGGVGISPLVFTVTGTSATNYATAFANAVTNPDTINVLSNGALQTTGGTVLNEIFSNNGQSTYALLNGGQYTLVDVGAPTTLVGSAAGGDTVLGVGDATYQAVGSDNTVTFVDGNNTYTGSSIPGATGDTITGGSGYDTINTGAGMSTVFSGSGHSLIVLNDTAPASSGTPDVAYLGDGTATVVANGQNDLVATGTNGQLIYGSQSATSTLNVVIGDNATSSGPAGDSIVGGAGTVNVFDSVGGNVIFGGTGTLTFVGQPLASGVTTVSDTIVGGGGTTDLSLSAGDSIYFAGDTAGGTGFVSAGDGNETLNAANAGGTVDFFGSTIGSANETFVGSNTGNNYFQVGGSTVTGDTTNSTLFGGSGNNLFGIMDGGPNSHITVYDFAAGNSSVNFLNETASQVKTDLANAVVGSSNGTPDLTVTLSDHTTITFVGITSLSGHVVNK